MKPLIIGLAGTDITQEERRFIAAHDPFGYILFTRNIADPAQLSRLTAELRALSGRERLPILIDEEGGRVQRMKPPHWPASPPVLTAAEAGEEALVAHTATIAKRLAAHGITVNCAPLLDIFFPEMHPIIGDRALGSNPLIIADRARLLAETLMRHGVLPIIKHIPGHGRARSDSHETLPVVEAPLEVLEQEDFLPFRLLRDMPFAMTAHILYTALDPDRCATFSPVVIRYIREKIGFSGLLMTDDLSMHALSGSFGERAEQALAAGSDLLLHCNGSMEEMEAIAAAVAPSAAAFF